MNAVLCYFSRLIAVIELITLRSTQTPYSDLKLPYYLKFDCLIKNKRIHYVGLKVLEKNALASLYAVCEISILFRRGKKCLHSTSTWNFTCPLFLFAKPWEFSHFQQNISMKFRLFQCHVAAKKVANGAFFATPNMEN